MASWLESLEIGENFERFVIDDIQNKLGLHAEKNEVAANLKFYDLILENQKTIECKCDERAEETKNICIETHCDGNESGILTTTADYWMVTDNVRGFLIKTSELKRCIQENYTSLFPDKPTKFLHMTNYPVKQGDGRVKLMNFYTIPTRIFKKYCDEVKKIDKMTYKHLITE
jgi:hypothetical protein